MTTISVMTLSDMDFMDFSGSEDGGMRTLSVGRRSR